jgi:16S rRNA G527 N7-methylase RsmG
VLDSFLSKYREWLPHLTGEQIAALESHLTLLKRWNRTINLTGIKVRQEAVQKHVGESLFLAAHLPAGPMHICDLGSGGGFPGVPVAIARPECRVSLVESDIRKGVFLREASRSLANVSVLSQRFESLVGEFDWLISRAVNISAIFGGPVCHRAAFLGVVEPAKTGITKRTVSSLYRWRMIPLPWDSASVLSIGEYLM